MRRRYKTGAATRVRAGLAAEYRELSAAYDSSLGSNWAGQAARLDAGDDVRVRGWQIADLVPITRADIDAVFLLTSDDLVRLGDERHGSVVTGKENTE